MARVRLMSANLWNGRADAGAFARLVEGLRPDVVAVQELAPAQADALARVMPYGRLEPAADLSGMGIALRQPGAVHRLSLPCRDARVAEMRIGDASGTAHAVEVINVHIAAPHLRPVHRAAAYRRGQLRGLQAYIGEHPDRPLALVGDFNSTPFWFLYHRIAHHLTDAALDLAHRHGTPPGRTWGPWPGSPRLLRIDHVFVHGLAVEDFQVVDIVGGDHSAVVADLVVSAHRP